MDLTVTVAGDGEHELTLEGATYADVIESVGLSVEEAVALVDGRPVPDDQPVDRADVTVLRLIHGG
ncbi:MAG: ubiquitin-like small modifier protein SAMP2 [Halobacteriota archaeon]